MVSYANIPEFIRNTTSVLNKEIEKGEKVILIIDSIDELKVLMGLPQDDFSLERYFPNLVKREKKEISIVFIKEKLEQTQFDFICDIIVELYLEIFHGRILRKLVIKKLRGEKIDFSVHLFSLSDGRFKCFVLVLCHIKSFLLFLKNTQLLKLIITLLKQE